VTRRFWVPLGHGYAVDSGGFLADPDRTVAGARWDNVDALTSEDLRHFRLLVMLGEPGMGKSTFLNAVRPLLPEGCTPVEVYRNLAEFGSEDRMVRSVFESARVEEWVAGSGELCLVLDGFDDAQIRIPQLGTLVAGFLGRWPVDRLWLRIACRTSDWPMSLAGALPKLTRASSVVELLPLRRTDVAEMTRDARVDPEPFLAEVEARGVGVLAARPLTLEFLLHTYTTDGQLPRRTSDLYRANLKRMCDEHSPERRAASPRPVSPGDLSAVARWVAAATVFSGATAVWLGPIPSPAGKELISVDDVADGTEPCAGGSVLATLSLVREVTRTPLFSGHGEAQMGWAHTTFQDFLAADWMLANRLPDHQVRSLLLADDCGVRPRFRRVAAWAVALDPDRFGWLTDADPESFVGEVDIPDPRLRQVLVERLLSVAGTNKLLGDFSTRYSGLAHPGLADQLAPVLAKSGPSRWFTIQLANDCDVIACDQALAAIALDPEAPLNERMSAGAALTWRGRAGDVLRPLVHDEELRRGDASHQLLGLGLRASWPHALSTKEVLDAVVVASKSNRRASFGGFVDEVVKSLTVDDLAAASAWLMKYKDEDGNGLIARVRDACIKLCVDHLDDPAAAVAAVAAAKVQLLHHDRILVDGEILTEHARRRLALLTAHADGPDTDVDLLAMLVCDSGALLTHDDFLWLFDLAGTPDLVHDKAVHNLLHRLVDPSRTDHVNAVLSVRHDSPLRSALSYWLDTCDLTAPEVVEFRANRQRMLERRARRTGPDNDIAERIATHLDEFENGDLTGYWIAARLVCVRPGTTHYLNEYQPDLTAHPRWDHLAPSSRDRLIALASRYLTEGRCAPEEWLGKQRIYFPAMAGYRALLLLLRFDPPALDTLSPTVWREWAPIIVEWQVVADGAQPQDKERLLRHALPYAREELRTALLTVIDTAIGTGGTHPTAMECDVLWDGRLAQELTSRLSGPLPDNVRADLTTTLMGNAPEAAQELLTPWLELDPEQAKLAATLLLSGRFRKSFGGWRQDRRGGPVPTSRRCPSGHGWCLEGALRDTEPRGHATGQPRKHISAPEQLPKPTTKSPRQPCLARPAQLAPHSNRRRGTSLPQPRPPHRYLSRPVRRRPCRPLPVVVGPLPSRRGSPPGRYTLDLTTRIRRPLPRGRSATTTPSRNRRVHHRDHQDHARTPRSRMAEPSPRRRPRTSPGNQLATHSTPTAAATHRDQPATARSAQ
jgi:hypothetical protein